MSLALLSAAAMLAAAAAASAPVKAPAFPEDPVLTALEAALPRGWHLTREKDRFVVEGDRDLWALPFNRINAPATWPDDARRQWERARATTPAVKAHFVFRFEPRWSAEKLAEVRARNKAVRDAHPPPAPASSGPSKNDWAAQRNWEAGIEHRLEPLPYDTGRYSVFSKNPSMNTP